MSKRSYRRATQWRELISSQAQSGQSVAAYCRERDLNSKTFYRHRKALGETPGINRTDTPFIRVSSATAKPSGKSELMLHYGACRLALPEDSDPAWVAVVMRALS